MRIMRSSLALILLAALRVMAAPAGKLWVSYNLGRY